jgi:hypothetical protein
MATEQQEHLKIEQLRQHSDEEVDHIEGREKENLERRIPTLATNVDLRYIWEKAIESRGDITSEEGRLSGCGLPLRQRASSSLLTSFVLIIPTTEKTKVNVSYADIAALAFTGRDTAAGKTFEAWVKKYWDKKAAGEKNIQIEPEKLD